ncbi:MAG: 1-acyl-sn-glycerol-3-phosphate acyltransferase [Planctomycetota bacterium]|jgi:1-acyl-sn-glycerol-3-phosphate acyltransferase
MGVLFGLRAVNVPKLKGPFILAPNHTSFLDPMLVQLVMPRHVSFMMDGKLYHHKLFCWFYRFWRVIPLSSATRAVGAMKDCLRAVKSGELVGIFPEGHIASDGQLQEGMAGVGSLMLRSRVPVIPVAILGAYDVLPRRAQFPRAGRILIVFGEPIQPDAEVGDRKEASQKLTVRVMEQIKALQLEHASQR